MSELGDNPGFFDLVGNMRAMRRLKPDPVPPQLLQKVLEAGVQAPSGMNSQPWSFVVIREPGGKKWFADRYKAAIEQRFGGFAFAPDDDSAMARQWRALTYQKDHMHEFPLLLIVCGLRDWPFRVPPEERVGMAPPNYGAVYPCVQNILLAFISVSEGDGAGWKLRDDHASRMDGTCIAWIPETEASGSVPRRAEFRDELDL